MDFLKKCLRGWKFWVGGFCLSCFLFLVMALFNVGGYFGDLPDLVYFDKMNRATKFEVFTSDGKFMGFLPTENHLMATAKELPHSIWGILQKQKSETQICKELLPFIKVPHPNGFFRELPIMGDIVEQWQQTYFIWLMKSRYTSEQLYIAYLNHCYFAGNQRGILEGAYHVFGKKPIELTSEEIEMLLKIATQKIPKNLPTRPQTLELDFAQNLRQELRTLEKEGYHIYRNSKNSPNRIYVTIHSKAQEIVLKAIKKETTVFPFKVKSIFIAKSPKTGKCLAWVGKDSTHYVYNVIFGVMEALKSGIKLCDTIRDRFSDVVQKYEAIQDKTSYPTQNTRLFRMEDVWYHLTNGAYIFPHFFPISLLDEKIHGDFCKKLDLFSPIANQGKSFPLRLIEKVEAGNDKKGNITQILYEYYPECTSRIDENVAFDMVRLFTKHNYMMGKNEFFQRGEVIGKTTIIACLGGTSEIVAISYMDRINEDPFPPANMANRIWLRFFEGVYAEEELSAMFPRSVLYPDRSLKIECNP